MLDEHSEIYSGMPDVIALKEEYTNGLIEIGSLISKLSRPYLLIYRTRQLKSAEFRKQIRGMLSMLLHFASKTGDLELVSLIKSYFSYYRTIPLARLYELGLHVKDLTETNLLDLAGLGYAQMQNHAYLAQLEAFKASIDQYDFQSNERKSDRRRLATKFQMMEELMKNRMDTFANLVAEDSPEFFRQYRQKRRKKSVKANSKPGEVLKADIGGTVSVQGSGVAVLMATITIAHLDLVTTTDADGYYLFDELPAGNYTVSCYAYGYEIPAPVEFTMDSSESLVVDFTLSPIKVPSLN